MNSKVISITRATSANENASLCGPCGGQCCSRMPGALLPSDLANETDQQAVWARVQELLATGRYAIDYLKGRDLPTYPRWTDERFYYLRPAIVGNEHRTFDVSMGGKCTFQGSMGCALSETARPTQCKLLVPAPNGKCSYSERWQGLASIARAWAPYYAQFEALW